MFDFLRDFGKSEEEKRQEALSAYLDNALTSAEKERFEQLLASDEALRASLEEQRLIQASMRRLPRLRAPRNFTLDPALFGRPMPSTSERLYPILRTATAVVAVLFVVVLVLEFLPSDGGEDGQPLAFSTEAQMEAEEAPAAAEAPAEEAPAAAFIEEQEVEITREVETVVRDEAASEVEADIPAEAPAEEMVEEEAAQEPEPAADAEAAPAEEPAAEMPPVEDEGLAAAPEAESATGQAAEAPFRTEATTAAGRMVEMATGTPMAQEAPLAATDAVAGQPTPGPAASPAAPESDDLADDGAAEDAPSPRTEIRLTSNQIVTIILGLGLLILIVATLLLRRSRRIG